MEPQELREVIAQALREGRTELDLWDKGLTELSPVIGRLAGLHTLCLRSNQLSALPPEIERLTELRTLDLRDNPLPIPPEMLLRTNDPAAILACYREYHSSAADGPTDKRMVEDRP